jgi:hypothetical protein
MTAKVNDAGQLVCERCKTSRRFNLVEHRGEPRHLCKRCERAVANEEAILGWLDTLGGIGRTVGELAAWTMLSPATVSKYLKVMEKRGGLVLSDEVKDRERARPRTIWRKLID